jgi:integrase
MSRTPGEIIQRGESTWLVRIDLGRTTDGRRHRISKTIHGTRKDAQTYLTAKLRERDLGTLAPRTTETLDAYLDRWLRDVAPMTRKPRTLSNDRNVLRLYVRPHLGGYRLADLSPLHVQETYRKLVAAGLSPKTVRHAGTTLGTALGHAVHPERLIPVNPVAGTKAPRLRKKEMRVFTVDQAVAFLRAVASHRHAALFTLALCTGMRPEEYLGLQRHDVDLPAGTLTVSRVLVNDHGKTSYEHDPKTDSARRVLLVPEPALTLLKAHMLTSPRKDPQAPVFAYPDGRPLDARNLNRRQFQPLCRHARLPVIRLYDLRHTHATLMHAAGVDPKVYGAGLGHSSITVTLDTYTHIVPAMKREAIERFEALLEAEAAPPPFRPG